MTNPPESLEASYIAETIQYSRPKSAALATIRGYIALTKPWILSLLLVTTLAAMLAAQQGWPSRRLLLATMLGGALIAAGASAINSCFDADIDGHMARTARRPVPQAQITPRSALIFGLILSIAGFSLLALFTNWLAATLALTGNLFYVLIYTRWLKRSTPMNIVIGGAAGAIPPLVGWAAVTGHLDLLAIYLFMIVFYWTPPHTWALTLVVEKDYARVGVPMLNVVYGQNETYRQIMLYLAQLIVITLLPVAFDLLGTAYLALALALNLIFVLAALRLWRTRTKLAARVLYKYSQTYLAILYLALVIDRWNG